MISVRVWVTPQARTLIEQALAWWTANRDAAPGLLRDELHSGLSLLRHLPDVGGRYALDGVPGLRRLLLRRTRYHLYYVHDDEAEQVVVLALWSAIRGRPPPIVPS